MRAGGKRMAPEPGEAAQLQAAGAPHAREIGSPATRFRLSSRRVLRIVPAMQMRAISVAASPLPFGGLLLLIGL